jgi:hypothetical protein
MRTEELVTLLATEVDAVEKHAVARSYAGAIALGTVVSTLMMVNLLGLLPDFAGAARLPMFWAKVSFAACLVWVSLIATLRLSKPGMRLEWLPAALLTPVLVVWSLAGVVLAMADPAQRTELVFGATWAVCPFLIAMLSLPLFVTVLWTMRGLAPTRPRLAGAAAGLLAGSLGALVYSLHCPEFAAPFIGLWYLLGMLIPTLAGTLLGPWVLRW